MVNNIVVIGSSGAIGSALVDRLSIKYPHARVYAFSRRASEFSQPNVHWLEIDYDSEESIAGASQKVWQGGVLSLVIVATGLLHGQDLMPEKSLRDLSFKQFERLFFANAALPAMIAKHFLPLMDKSERSVFAAISARVGSISDNRLGGWYAYRASKAALNMLLKNAAIEMAWRSEHHIVIGLHPGTVDSSLSRPFQKGLQQGQLFSPEYSASCLVNVLESVKAADSGKVFAWDGSEVLP